MDTQDYLHGSPTENHLNYIRNISEHGLRWMGLLLSISGSTTCQLQQAHGTSVFEYFSTHRLNLLMFKKLRNEGQKKSRNLLATTK